MTDVFIYHDHCVDGFSAAWIYHRYNPEAIFIPMKYGTTLKELLKHPSLIGKDLSSLCINMVDVTLPSREEHEILNLICKRFIVLDHHKTAAEMLKDLDYAFFDDKHCGSELAHKFWHTTISETQRDFLAYVEDRDLWKWKLPRSKEVSAAIASYSYDFKIWECISNDVNRLKQEGQAILRYQDQLIKDAVKRAVVMQGAMEPPYFFGAAINDTFAMVNSSVLQSEIGNALCVKHEIDFAAIWFTDFNGGKEVDKVSLRSIGDFDVSKIAAMFGGGGHKNAAGFII